MEKGDTILLAEDSENDLMLMRYAFSKAGVKNRVHEVRDGLEAIQYLEGKPPYSDREQNPLPCVIITDLKMPQLDGLALLDWLQHRPEFARVPKLVLSSSNLDRDQDNAAKLGACGYFVKPSGIDALVKVVIAIDKDWISEHCPMPAS